MKLVILFLMLIFATINANAKTEDPTSSVLPVSAYGTFNGAILPIKVTSDGTVVTSGGSSGGGAGAVTNLSCSDDIQTKVTAATAGNTLVLGSCTYTITSAITINKALSIVGQGPTVTIISTAANNISAFTITSDNVTIQNVKITGTAPNTTASVAYIMINGSGSSTFQNVNLQNIWVSTTSSSCVNQVITYYDAGGKIDNSRIESTCAGTSGQLIGILAKYYSTNDASTTIRIKNTVVGVTATDSAFSGNLRGIMHWHNGADVSPVDTTMIIEGVKATCALTAGGNDTECLQNQGPNVPGSVSVGVDYTYVYNSSFDGTIKCYAGFSSTSCRDYRIDDYANTSLYNVTLGTNQVTTQNNATINRFGSVAVGAIVGTEPQQAAGSLVGQNAIDLVAQKGGDTPSTGSQTGKTGGGYSLVAGLGGQATQATTTGTGGNGGAFVLTGAAGADQTISTSTTNVGGTGGAITQTTGAGGAASLAGTTNTGGAGGDLTLNTGAGGVGTTTTGNNGAIVFKVGGSEKGRFQTSGSLDLSSGLFSVGSSKLTVNNSGNTIQFTSTNAGSDAFHIDANSLTGSQGLEVDSTSTVLTNSMVNFVESGNSAGVTGDVLRVQMSGASSTGPALHVFGTNATNAKAAIFENGNVGIKNTNPLTELEITGSERISGTFTSTRTTDLGWSVVAGANTACNTTCTNACVFGEDTSVVGTIVSCTDATADQCLCAGSN